MINLTTPVSITKAITKVQKIQVIAFEDHDEASPPYAWIAVKAYSNGGQVYGPGNGYQIKAVDGAGCLQLIVNSNSQVYEDQIITTDATIATAYTTVTAAFYGASGGKNQRLIAVEAAAASVGLFSAAFAGT